MPGLRLAENFDWQMDNPNTVEQTRHKRRRRSLAATYVLFKKTQRHVPPGIRALAGLVLICAGLLGFLPILGFWMIPLGLAVLATDIPPLKRWIRARLSRKRQRGPGASRNRSQGGDQADNKSE